MWLFLLFHRKNSDKQVKTGKEYIYLFVYLFFFNTFVNWYTCTHQGCLISNGNRTEQSPIWSVIIRPCSGSPIWLIMSMITDWIGLHVVLLPKFVIYKALFLKSKQKKFQFFLLAVKKSHLRACMMSHIAQLLRHDAYCPIKLSY